MAKISNFHNCFICLAVHCQHLTSLLRNTIKQCSFHLLRINLCVIMVYWKLGLRTLKLKYIKCFKMKWNYLCSLPDWCISTYQQHWVNNPTTLIKLKPSPRKCLPKTKKSNKFDLIYSLK